MNFEQLAGHGLNGFPGLALDALPGLAAQAVQAGFFSIRARILLDQIDALNRHVQFIAADIFEVEIVARGIGHAQVLEPVIAGNAVVGVDHIVAGSQLAESGQIVGHRTRPGTPSVAALAENLFFGQEDQSIRWQRKTLRQMPHHNRGPRAYPPNPPYQGGIPLRVPHPRRFDREFQLMTEQEMLKVVGLALTRNGQIDLLPLVLPLSDTRDKRGQAFFRARRRRAGFQADMQHRSDGAVGPDGFQAAHLNG